MRVIAADGTIDAPYGSITLCVDDEIAGWVVEAITIESGSLPLGTYDTKERAVEVLEEIRMAYTLRQKIYQLPKR